MWLSGEAIGRPVWLKLRMEGKQWQQIKLQRLIRPDHGVQSKESECYLENSRRPLKYTKQGVT